MSSGSTVKSLLVIAMISPAVFFCNGFSTQQLLDGDFIAKDFNPVDLLSPSDKSIASENPKFSWSKRSGALSYLLELSTTSDFGNVILNQSMTDTTYTLKSNDLTGIGQLEGASYYWRVTAAYTNQKIISGSFVFHVLDDTIVYVDGSSMSGDQIGNKTFPYKTIQGAIENANTRRNGIASVVFDIRIAKATYEEEVNLRPGISIKGGYESATWSRDIVGNVTLVNAPTDAAIRGNSAITAAFTTTTVVDGLTIKGGTSGSENYGISLVGASPTISNNTINGGSGGTSYGIANFTFSAAPVISNNTIVGGSGSTNYAIYYYNSTTTNCSLSIAGNTITGGSGATRNYGIYIFRYCSLTIANNTITGGSGVGSNYSMYLDDHSSPSITNNTITGGSAGTTYGIFSNMLSNPVIQDNIITGGSGTTNYGIRNELAAFPPISKNTILGGTGANNYAIYTEGPCTIYNNFIIGGNGATVNYGIHDNTSGTVILNNTINGGTAGTTIAAIHLTGNLGKIQNNIIFNSSGTGRCISEVLSGSDPLAVQNNNLFGCATLYRDHDTATDITNLTTSITLPTGTLASMGNISIDNTGNQLFADQNGPDGNVFTMNDNDWHLTTNAAICNVRGGGLNLSASFTLDRDGLTRTVGGPSGGCVPGNMGQTGWSMGVFESN